MSLAPEPPVARSPAERRLLARVSASGRRWREPGDARAFDRAGWRALGALGVLGLVVPRRLGGQGCGPAGAAAALETLGYLCPARDLLFCAGAHMWGVVQPLLAFGTPRQKQLLPALCSGRAIGAHAASEPQAGSDVSALRASAERTRTGYALSGTKAFVTNGPVADVLLVYARVAQEGGALAAFLVPRSAGGLETRRLSLMGLSGAPVAELTLRGCRVPAEARLGARVAGQTLFQQAMEWERGLILAPAVGRMARLLERCLERAASRVQFGRPLSEHGAVAARLAEMRVRLETSRALLRRFAALKSEGRSAAAESAMAKLHISESWIASCEDAMQIFGGEGYSRSSGLERELRDALASRAYSGTPDIQRLIIARAAGAERAA